MQFGSIGETWRSRLTGAHYQVVDRKGVWSSVQSIDCPDSPPMWMTFPNLFTYFEATDELITH